jgi:pyridoxamine 5'-phosphate oxidase
MDLCELRLSYTKAGLLEADVDPDPFRQFGLWMTQAIAIGLLEPNAMTLSTADASGQPSARTVLLKGFDPDGFVFYTNYESRKGCDIAANPKVSLLFYWDALERQVRIAGVASRVSEEESDTYFVSRPVGHQIGAWVSRQSTVIEGRQAIEERIQEMTKNFERAPVPRPPYWGGYRVCPHSIEFWQGREDRLHDRIEYIRDGETWTIRRLSP